MKTRQMQFRLQSIKVHPIRLCTSCHSELLMASEGGPLMDQSLFAKYKRSNVYYYVDSTTLANSLPSCCFIRRNCRWCETKFDGESLTIFIAAFTSLQRYH